MGISAVVLLAGAVGLLGLRKRPPIAAKLPEIAASIATAHEPLPSSAVGPARVQPSTEQVRAPQGLAAPSAEPDAPDEPSLMTTLRGLRGSDPERTLALARDGNQRFPNSPDVAERSWVIVKSLSDLGRHDEARAEGRILLERFRDTRWGEDVYRHLFVNPGTHPFERGYGKQLESD
jgi:hypothetical protein